MSRWTNISSLLLKGVSSGLQLQTYYDTKAMFFSSIVNLLICMLGTPGNILVMTMYVQKITTCISVYVFALVVVGLTTCVSGIILTVASIDNKALVLVFFADDVDIIFS